MESHLGEGSGLLLAGGSLSARPPGPPLSPPAAGSPEATSLPLSPTTAHTQRTPRQEAAVQAHVPRL